MNEVDAGSSGFFQLPHFLAMMTRKIDENSAEDEIREAFKVFDSVSRICLKHWKIYQNNWRMGMVLSTGKSLDM